MSTPRTVAPSFAAGMAVVPSPQPRSRTRISLVIPSCETNASPLSRMLSAMRVKSPFSQSALLGFAVTFIICFWGCRGLNAVRVMQYLQHDRHQDGEPNNDCKKTVSWSYQLHKSFGV